MRRRIGTLIGLALLTTVGSGCVVDPYYQERHGRRYDDRAYDDDRGHDRGHDRPPPNYHDRDRNRYEKLPTLVCASKSGRPKRCHTEFEIRAAEIDKRYSGSPCEYGRSWGYDRNEVWVDNGCRARFILHPAGRAGR